ncbi:MAG: A/G-specific adenine glycosylase [Treponema sp.]|nr:A/G-specific adenine glycosylase [Treponema sp.]
MAAERSGNPDGRAVPLLSSDAGGIRKFKKIVSDAYIKEGRRFPWREGADPWGVLVSEFMLQQTQTQRVESYWPLWMQRWPTPESLDRASLEDALRAWSGLGYNRRALHLKRCARIIAADFGGKVPALPEALARLPGIGAYSAGAIACFAYNHPSAFIETNIRAVMLHFFFSGDRPVRDSEILPLLERALDRKNPREWHWALMDYGAALKKRGPNPGRLSAHHIRQSGFRGSFRQLRGDLLRALVTQGPARAEELRARLESPGEKADFYRALDALRRESMVAEEAGVYRIK